MLCPRRPGEARRKRPIHPQDGGCHQKDSQKDFGLRNDSRPEDAQITDRRKPQPIHQEVTRDPQQDKADRENGSSNEEPPYYASPSCWQPLPSCANRLRLSLSTPSCVANQHRSL